MDIIIDITLRGMAIQMILKEYKEVCPECGEPGEQKDKISPPPTDGVFCCPHCSKPSVKIEKWVIFRVRNTIYEILVLDDANRNLIGIGEVARLNSPLNKPNKNYFVYFNRSQIIEFMSENFLGKPAS